MLSSTSSPSTSSRTPEPAADVAPRLPSTTTAAAGGSSSKAHRYPCDHDGCTKAFSRRDHLERHQLNHAGKVHACDLCQRSFARPDVLKRHVANHALKAEEGGGGGEDSRSLDDHPPASKRQRRAESVARSDVESSSRRSSSSSGSPASARRLVSDKGASPASQTAATAAAAAAESSPSHQAASSLARVQPGPSTASGTPAIFYPILFPPPDVAPVQTPPVTTSATVPLSLSSFSPDGPSTSHHHQQHHLLSQQQQQSHLTAGAHSTTTDWCFPPPASPLPNVSQAPIGSMDQMLAWLFDSTTPESLASLGLADGTYNSGGGGGGGEGESSLMALAQVALPADPNPRLSATPSESLPAALFHSSDSAWDAPHLSSADETELITPTLRQAVLNLYLPSTSPTAFAELEAAFSLDAMRIYLELFFMHFDPLHPILHRPTLGLRPGGMSPFVLAAVCCIGAAYAEEKSGWRAAVGFTKRLRNRILEAVEENPRIEMELLQTLMLVNWFGRYFASATMHDVSQVFHSSTIVISGFTGILVPQEPPAGGYESSREGWCAWAVAEERKRLAWFVFLADTSNAALFRSWLLVHCYYMEVEFPCADPLWHATSPAQWGQEHLKVLAGTKEMSFRDALRLLVGRGQIGPGLNDFSVWILLHGLISICWTLLWRDLGDLSMVHESKITGWKDTLRLSFGFWRDFVSKRFVARTSAGWDPLDMHCHWAGISLCNLGVILLLSETDLIRIFAGATEVAGRFIAPSERTAAQRKLSIWARSADGLHSFKAALELLKSIFSWASESRFQTGPATTPWCVYISTLVVFTFSTLLDGRANLVEPAFISFASPQDTEPKIEPSLARKAAIFYCSRLLAAPTLEDLARAEGKNRCGSVIAYSAFLCGMEDRGIMRAPRAMLLDMLMGRK